jgi:hypothetical protein
MIRVLIYITLPARRIDERGFAVAKAIRAARPPGQRLSQPRLKELFTEQFLLLKMDEARAIEALPQLLPTDMAQRREALIELKRVVAASGSLSEESAKRLAEVEALFGVPPEPVKDSVPAGAETPAVTPPIKAAPVAAAAQEVITQSVAVTATPADTMPRSTSATALPPKVVAPKGPPPDASQPKTSPQKVH